jgi:kojibiose phosphorylase
MTGEEVTPPFLPDGNDPSRLIRIWTRDTSVHIGADVSFAVHQYWRISGDDAFMAERGAEILFETARFYASRSEWNAAAGRYEYTNVTGPDEYHERVSNNAFTNYLAAWNLRAAAAVAEWLQSAGPRDKAVAQPTADEVAAWHEVAARIYLPRDPESGLVEQSDGFFGLRDENLAAYRGRTKSMQALLGLEDVPRTQILKQPDVLMLAFMMPNLFGRDELARLDAYYTPRTDLEYGSSLGPGIQAILSCQVGATEAAYGHFIRAARADLRDVRGNSGDGIHGASAGAIWQAVVFGFAGLRVDDDGWLLRPRLPEHWTRVAFRFSYRGEYKQVDIRRLPGVGSEV